MGTPIIDVAIGLALVYLVLALVCTMVNEYIAQILSLRAENLWKGVQSLFQNSSKAKAFTEAIYGHGLIQSLTQNTTSAKPSYIPSHIFSLALTDNLKLTAEAAKPISEQLKAADLDSEIFATLRPLAAAAGSDLDQFRKNVETWFDAAMERASGWYKKRLQTITFWVAVSVVLISNADTLRIVDTLWSDSAVRQSVATAATNLVKETNAQPAGQETPTPALEAAQKAAGQEVGKLLGWRGPISWKHPEYRANDPNRFPAGTEWFAKILGLLLSALAASLGAPFWFDILNKIVNIRSAGGSPVEKPRNPSTVPQPQARIPSLPPPSAGSLVVPPGSATGSTPGSAGGK